MDQPLDALTFITNGSRHGSRAGFLSSLLLASLNLGVPSLIGILRNTPYDWSIYLFMAIYAGILGVLPAVIVGAVVGAIMGFAFYRLKNRLQAIWHARFVGGLVGLVVVFPVVFTWLDFLFSPRGTVIRIPNRPPSLLDWLLELTITGVSYLALIMLCVAPGIYVGGRLWQLLLLEKEE